MAVNAVKLSLQTNATNASGVFPVDSMCRIDRDAANLHSRTLSDYFDLTCHWRPAAQFVTWAKARCEFFFFSPTKVSVIQSFMFPADERRWLLKRAAKQTHR